MKEVSIGQQRLAHNQVLPPIQRTKFLGAPAQSTIIVDAFGSADFSNNTSSQLPVMPEQGTSCQLPVMPEQGTSTSFQS
ncbi:hypothetical protein ACROYT_G013936 [Oculina patagonica]